ncbi:MAG TPA: hypothetical protein VN026_15130 [Bacteroidia bacterium]|jgi:hypothetical protein|nr:hypothetical protein [Bacteroidia bacterium]
MATIYTAVAILGMTAIIGMYLISLVLKDKPTPIVAAIVHGIFAILGVALLVNYCVWTAPRPVASMTVFIIAALGGLTLGYKHVTGKKLPKWLAVVHGLAAVTGYVLLLCFAFF